DQDSKKRCDPGGKVETRGRRRGQHLFAIASDKHHGDLFLPFSLTHLFSNCLFGWHGKTALEVITTVHGQAAATLTGESFLNLLGGGHSRHRSKTKEEERRYQ